MNHLVAMTCTAALLLGACQEAAAELPHPVLRPVLTTVVAAQPAAAAEFVGKIEARYVTQLGFRVGGRIVRRSVAVGDRVQQGAEIALLDAEALGFAVKAAEASLAAVEARWANANTSRERQAKLLQGNAVAASKLDEAQASFDAASAAVAEAQARLAKAREDAGYAKLRAEFAGVITRVDAEAGQAVGPNTVVAELARTDALDVVVDVPEALVDSFPLGTVFRATAHGEGAAAVTGKVRRVGPIADRATRTRRLWIALDASAAALRLGTVMHASVLQHDADRIVVPAQAIVDTDDTTAVFVLDGDHVSARTVTLAQRSQHSGTVAHGLQAGERIVVAGVHSLADGQRVKLTDEARP
jgi:membrane fusion protein, multidrug efflux system